MGNTINRPSSNVTWFTSEPSYFNECFEKTISTWIPSVFFIVFLPLELTTLYRSKFRSIPWSFLSISKMILLTLLVALSIVNLIRNISSKSNNLENVASLGVKCATNIVLWILVPVHKIYGVRTSGVQFNFWLLSALSSITPLLSLIRKEHQGDFLELILPSLEYTSVYLMLLLWCFSEKKPKYHLQEEEKQYSFNENEYPEENASYVSTLFFCWLTPFIWKLRKKIITVNDIFNGSFEDKTTVAVQRFQNYLIKGSQESNNSLVPALIKTFGPSIIAVAPIQMISDVLFCTVSFTLILFIDLTSEENPFWKGIFYCIILFVQQFVFGIMDDYYTAHALKTSLRLKSAITITLFKKVMKLSSSSRRHFTMGEIQNSISVDVQTVTDLVNEIQAIWTTPIHLGLYMFVLWKILGVTAFIGLGLTLLSLPINVIASKWKHTLQVELMRYKDKSMKTLNEVLRSIKILKFNGWEKSFEEKLLEMRQHEINVLKRICYVNAFNSTFFNFLPPLLQFITLTSYLIHESVSLTTITAFMSFRIFLGVRRILTIFPGLLNALSMAQVSSKRINALLNAEETSDYVINREKNVPVSIEVLYADFGWSKDSAFLKNISIRVPKGSLVAIIGDVGSGKSSIISAILGDMYKISGQVIVNGSLAYVPQQPWIQNASGKDNILFDNIYEERRFDDVVRVCSLNNDIQSFPANEETEIGENGINLSGGQKQRMNLARAAYMKSDIYLLDDPLSAVDAYIGNSIFENLIGRNGFLKHKTRILVTHNLALVREVDFIIIMKNGIIVNQGPPDKISFNETYFEALAKKTSPELESKQDNRIDDESVMKTRNNAEENYELVKDLILPESVESCRTSSEVLGHYLNSFGVALSIVVILCLFAQQALYLGSTYWLALWSNDLSPVMMRNGTILTKNLEPQDTRIAIYAVLVVSQGLLLYLGSFLLLLGSHRASRKLDYEMLTSVIRSPESFFNQTPLGRILNRFSTDVDEVDSKLPDSFCKCLLRLVGIISNFVAISIEIPDFIVTFLIFSLFFLCVQRLYAKTSLQLKRINGTTRSPLYSHFTESLAGVHVIRAHDAVHRFVRKAESLIDKNRDVENLRNYSVRWLSARVSVLGSILVLSVTLSTVFRDGEIAPANVAYIIHNVLALFVMLFNCTIIGTNVEDSFISVERIIEYSRLQTEGDLEIPKQNVNRLWPENGEIRFNQYCARYREGLDLALINISIVIKPREKIGVVGRTGAGKSSLTSALFRLIEAASGSIIIDGINIAEIGLSDLRSRLTIIPQDPVLFAGTLRLNLDPLNNYSDHDIYRAIDHAHLNLLVKTFPDGLEHEIAEGGENLSVGQRQLVCLARALLRNTRVLVLDEATASVDFELDNLIQRTIRQEFNESTVITIAHRINTIMDCDRVMVMSQGCVIEFDKPLTLMSNSKSMFHNLAKEAGLLSENKL